MRQSGANIYTVTQVNHAIKLLLEDQDAFRNLYIQGELSNYKKYPSGHHYFTLKDADGVLSAVMFRSDAARLRFQPENGMKVIARGRISVYPQRGQYQMYVADMMPDGIGALTIAFEQLKQRLYQEGLFDEGHKKPIPRLPARIAVVTSPTGAAVRDILRILKQRYPIAHVVIYPVLVQGKEAAGQIVAAIEAVNRRHDADVMIVGRGGGSLEDLWAFNEEIVARALYASEIPVIPLSDTSRILPFRILSRMPERLRRPMRRKLLQQTRARFETGCIMPIRSCAAICWICYTAFGCVWKRWTSAASCARRWDIFRISGINWNTYRVNCPRQCGRLLRRIGSDLSSRRHIWMHTVRSKFWRAGIPL